MKKQPTPKKDPEAPLVRPKASHRKTRTAEVTRIARVPAQERSRLRYQQIIAATEQLLETANIEDISLYDVAAKAGIAPPSVHYLFNTMAAIHIELNRLYNIQLTELTLARQGQLVAARTPGWQEWVRTAMRAAADALNGSRAMSEIMLGPVLHRRSTQASREMNGLYAQSGLQMMREVFVMPDIPQLERILTYSIEISESLWSGAYVLRGRIDDETFEESVRASIAYLRCYLPDTLMLRPAAPPAVVSVP